MTPQSTFMVLAAIHPAREAELRELLDSMNHGPGRVNPNNDLIPFAEFDTLHFARFVILDDKTTEDIRVYGLAPRTYPLYLAFLGDMDGDADVFLKQLIQRAGKGLARIFSCCEGFAPDDGSSEMDEATRCAGNCCLRKLSWTNRAPDSRGSGTV